MEPKNNEKVLVAIDGSESAFQTILYLNGIHSFKKKEIVIFSVYEGVPDCYWDISSNPAYIASSASASLIEAGKRKTLETEFNKAKKVLLSNGFVQDNIKLKLQKRNKGIARDIIAEASNGYSLVLAGRKGVRRIEQIIFGSVATKLLEKLSFTSLLLVGKGAVPGNLLVAVDGSEVGWKIIEFIKNSLEDSRFQKVTLVHVIRNDGGADQTLYPVEEIQKKMASTLEQMIEKLIGSGVSSSAVDYHIITNVSSRAEAIVNYARTMGYTSIALGRRGLSNVADFSMGRVAAKVTQLSRGLAVWVIC